MEERGRDAASRVLEWIAKGELKQSQAAELLSVSYCNGSGCTVGIECEEQSDWFMGVPVNGRIEPHQTRIASRRCG